MNTLKQTKLIIIFIILFFFSVSAAMASDNKDQLSNKIIDLQAFGTQFNVPNNWVELNKNAIIENLDKLNSSKENISKLLYTHRGSITVATFSKYDPKNHPGVIPTINILIRNNNHTTFPSFLNFIKLTNQSLSKVLNNFQIINDVLEKTVSGKKAVSFLSRFDINLADGTTKNIINLTYAIPFEKSFIQISMSEEFPAKNSKLFEGFIKSFTIKK